MNPWIVRLLNVASALLALLAGLAFGGVVGDAFGPLGLGAALACSLTALVLRVARPSQARWQPLYIGLTIAFLAVALVTWAVDPADVGSEDCGVFLDNGGAQQCGGEYSYLAIVVLPATILAFAFAWLSVGETPTPRA